MRLSLPVGEVDLLSTLGPLDALRGDPTVHLAPGRFARGTATPAGPAAVQVTWDTGGVAEVETSGDGAAWLAERVPGLLGLLDDVTGFAPAAPPLHDLWRRHRGGRIARTGTLWHDLAWFVVQQRVTRGDAAAQWQRLVTDLGSPAPGVPGLVAPPAPGVVGRLSYADLHRYGIERRRADALLHAARAVGRLERLVDGDVDDALPALRSVPGVGPWTASCLATHTWGARDALIVGDDGIPSMVAWLLARERRADDARMAELLEPYRPHRYRVVRLVFHSGQRPPRRAPHGRPHDVRSR